MRGAKPRSPRLADPSAPPTGDVRTDIQFPPVDVMHLPSPSVAAYRGLIVALILADQRLASGVHPQRAYIDALSAVSQFVGSDVLRRRPAGRHRSGQIGPHRPYSPARHWTRADALSSRVITRIVRTSAGLPLRTFLHLRPLPSTSTSTCSPCPWGDPVGRFRNLAPGDMRPTRGATPTTLAPCCPREVNVTMPAAPLLRRSGRHHQNGEATDAARQVLLSHASSMITVTESADSSRPAPKPASLDRCDQLG
jgi:hypothetical protein